MKTPSLLLSVCVTVCLGIAVVGCGKKEAPVAESAPADPGVGGALEQAGAATKAKDYEKAAQILVAFRMGNRQMSDQQALALREQMQNLQVAITEGLVAGDPKAKAASEILARSASGR